MKNLLSLFFVVFVTSGCAIKVSQPDNQLVADSPAAVQPDTGEPSLASRVAAHEAQRLKKFVTKEVVNAHSRWEKRLEKRMSRRIEKWTH